MHARHTKQPTNIHHHRHQDRRQCRHLLLPRFTHTHTHNYPLHAPLDGMRILPFGVFFFQSKSTAAEIKEDKNNPSPHSADNTHPSQFLSTSPTHTHTHTHTHTFTRIICLPLTHPTPPPPHLHLHVSPFFITPFIGFSQRHEKNDPDNSKKNIPLSVHHTRPHPTAPHPPHYIPLTRAHPHWYTSTRSCTSSLVPSTLPSPLSCIAQLHSSSPLPPPPSPPPHPLVWTSIIVPLKKAVLRFCEQRLIVYE